MARGRKPKPRKKVVIDYPPVPQRKWIPPDQRPKKPRPPKYKKPEGITQRLDISSLRKIWNQYYVYGPTAILVAHYSQTHKRFNFISNGLQGTCNCAIACTFAHLFKMGTWDRYRLDHILEMGNALYLKSITAPGEDHCLIEVPPKKVFPSFFFEKSKISLSIDDGPKVTDTLSSVSEPKVKEIFGNALQNFFKSYPSGIFGMLGKYLAIWIQDEAYYLFDPTEHTDDGEVWTGISGYGLSVLCRTKALEILVEHIYKNVNAKIPYTKFDIVQCVVQRIVQINTDPPEALSDILPFEPPIVETEDMKAKMAAEAVPINEEEEKLREYLEAEANEVTSMDARMEELAPHVTDEFSVSKRPSWLGTGAVKKDDLCKLPIPEKKKVERVTYYIEMVPGTCGILRANTCQTDINFSKYLGRQSMGNAISALIMLRLYPSKIWIPRIVNSVLKHADLIYRDAMVNIPRTQSLKLSNFQRKTEVEGKLFSPAIEDYVVVGRLQSVDYDVLDLQPALESFLVDHQCCVVQGPLVLAVWYEEDRYYMFDPNERDKNGCVIKKTAMIGSNAVPIDFIPGVACVTWFSKLKDLVDLYMNNVEKPLRQNPFYLSKVTINDFVDPPESWYQFKGLIPGKWILRGTKSQSSRSYSKKSRNFQSPAISLYALTLQMLTPIKDWSTETIDEVLDKGDALYLASINALTEKEGLENRMLTLGEINKSVKIQEWEARFDIDEGTVSGVINAKEGSGLLNLFKGLTMFFQDNDTGIVTSHNISVAVWKKAEIYYCFDAHNRDDKGMATGYGTACILRTLGLEELAQSLEANLHPGTEDFYTISRVKMQFYEAGEGDVVRPPLNFYTKITNDAAILRSLYSEISPKYEINCNKQTVPMCLAALGFSRLKPTGEWSKADLDEVLNKGDNLYVQTMIKIQEEEESQLDSSPNALETGEEEEEEEKEDASIKSQNVKTDFSIGLNKMRVEFEDVDEGNIKENLKQALKNYFEPQEEEGVTNVDLNSNKELLLESKPLSVAIWRDNKVYYYFDSKPRDKCGLTIGMEDWSGGQRTPPPEVEEEQQEEPEEVEADEGIEDVGEDGDEREQRVVNPDRQPGDQAPYVPEQLDEDLGQQQEEGAAEIPYQIPIVHKSSSYWREQEKMNGRACTMWFTKLADLVDHVYGNIPLKDRLTEEFKLLAVKINNEASIKDKLRPDDVPQDVYAGDWYCFDELERGSWILRGTMTLHNELFPEPNRGKQQAPTCFVALLVPFCYHMLCYNKATVDTILSYGDKLHTYVKRTRRKQLKANRELKLTDDEIDWLVNNEEFAVGDVPRRICLSKFFVELELAEDFLEGDIKAQAAEDILDVQRGLETFFQENKYGLLQCRDLLCAIWRGQKTYYMFDAMSRGPNGVRSPNGVACITRFMDLKKMADLFLANVCKYGKNAFSIHKVNMTKDLCPRDREPKKLVDKTAKVTQAGGFQRVIPGKCIVRGSLNQEDPKFGQAPNILAAPIAVIALTMSLVHKPSTWSKPLVDDILELGAELYEESAVAMGMDFNPWDERMSIYNVKNDYTVGVLKANCELRHMDQKGIMDAKDEDTVNLRQGIERFFEENTHGILVSEPLTLALWEEEEDNGESVIYMYDPNPRGPFGMPLYGGTACVMTFVNAKVASDHILGCILEPEKKMCEFTIVPVEICVGNLRTMRKIHKSPTRSTLGLPARCSKLVADEQKKLLRRIAENEFKRKEARRLQMIGRKGWYLMRGGEAIIRGYRSQNSANYSDESRNNQDIPNCIVAVVMHTLFPIDNWIGKHVDLVLDTGDQLYIDSYIAYGPKDLQLGMENILRKFFLKQLEIHVTVYQPIITDALTASNLARVLDVYFQQEQLCILNLTHRCFCKEACACHCSQWLSVFFKSGYFYVFDPHERDIEGNRVKLLERNAEGKRVKRENVEAGAACVVRFDNLNSLAYKVVSNYYMEEDDDREEIREFTLWLISVENKYDAAGPCKKKLRQ